MRKLLAGVALLALGAGSLAVAAFPVTFGTNDKAEVAHIVYFTLKDDAQTAKAKLVDACKKYLTMHPGEVFFRVGTRGIEFKRSVNDVDFDVALHIIFENTQAYDRYEAAPRHKQFIEENKDNWKKVRVFDSVVIK